MDRDRVNTIATAMRSTVDRLGVIENLNTAVLTFNHTLHLTSLNPAAEMLLDKSANRALGETLSALFPRNPQLEQTVNTALANYQLLTAHEEQLHIDGHGTVTVDYTVTPVNDDAGCTVVVMEMVRVDRLLRLAREERMLRRHTTNRAVMRGMAHEIKNPLGGIRGAAQLLERELTDPALKEYTQVIIQETDRLRTLVDRMFGPNRPLKQQAVNIHELLERVRRLVLAEVQDGIHLSCDYDPSLPEVHADPDQLIQAILNIARNSIQAMKHQGTLQFRTRAERQFTVRQKRHRLVVRLDIEDDGPGIPGEMLDNIFYPMVTGRPDGSGLGLSIAQDIIANHGGLIECSSHPKQTVFSVFLPLEEIDGATR